MSIPSLSVYKPRSDLEVTEELINVGLPEELKEQMQIIDSCPTGHDLHLMSQFPKSPAPYENSYIFIKTNNTQELYYIKSNGESEKVKIDNFNLFEENINAINKNNDGTKLHLSEEQIKEIVTSNGGHTPGIKEKIESIIDKLYKANELDDQIARPIVYLSGVNEELGAMISSAKQPVLLLGKGLLKNVLSEDELAGVIAHELGHLILYTQDPEAKHHGKMEETAADNLGLKLLSEAGYNPEGVIFFLRRADGEAHFIAADKKNPSSLKKADYLVKTLTDPHPSSEDRIRAMQSHIVALKRDGVIADESPEAIPLDPVFKAEAAAIHYESPVTKGLKEEEYELLPVVQKLKILTQLLKDIYPPTNRTAAERVEELATHIQKLSVDFSDPEQKEVFLSLIDLATEERFSAGNDRVHSKKTKHGDRIDKNLDAALEEVWRRGGQALDNFGRSEHLKEILILFCEAKTPEEAEQYAAKIIDLCNKIYSYNRKPSNFQGFQQPSWKEIQAAIQEKGEWYPPYSKHVQWCHERQSENIKKVLYGMQVQYDSWVKNILGDGGYGCGYILNINAHWNDLNEYVRKEDGSITGAIKKDEPVKAAPRVASESPYQWKHSHPNTVLQTLINDHKEQGEKKRQHEENIVNTVDWQRLKTDFPKFILQYGALLNHHYSLVPVPSPFAERFFAELSALLPTTDEDFKVQLRDFFRHPRDEDTPKHPSTIYHFYNLYPSNNNWPYVSIPKPNYRDVNDPFIQFLLKTQSSGIIQDDHKLWHLNDASNFLKPNATKKLMDIFTTPLRTILAKYPQDIKTVADLDAAAKSNTSYEKITIALEAERLAYQFENTLTLEEFVVLDKLASLHDKEVYVSNIASFFDQLRHKTAQRYLNTDDCAELIKNYRYVIAYYFLHDAPAIRNTAQEKIKKLLSQLSAQEKLDCLSALFRPEVFTPWSFAINAVEMEKKYDGYLADPAFRDWAIETFTDELAAQLKTDDGSPDFVARAKPVIDELAKNTAGITKLQILSRLATKINAQQEIAYYMCKIYNKGMISDGLSKHGEGVVVEVLIEETSCDPLLRQHILDYLSNPLTKDSQKPLSEYLQKKYAYKFRDLSAIAIDDQLHNYHKNFRAAPFKMRTAYLEPLLFSPDSSDNDQKKTMDQLIHDVFPLKTKSVTYNEYAQLIVRSYLQAIVLPERRLIGTALFVANMREEGAAEQTTGQKLNMILSHMGPAGAKLLQAIHSHPQTPADLKKDIASAKIMFAPPLRWELIETIEKSGVLAATAENPNPVTYIGKLVGAGSFGLTVFNTLSDGKQVADTFLRPNAAKQAEREFKIMSQAAHQIVQSRPELSPVTFMVDEAQRSARDETNMKRAEIANQLAEKSYQHIKVVVGEYDFIHQVTALQKTGEQFKRVTIAQGEHFNDLSDSPYKKALAKAIIASQLSLRLAGCNTDLDRHGGNIKVQGNTISHFDFGAMNVTPLTDEDKRITGTILAQTVLAVAKGKDFTQALLSNIQNAQVSEASRIYLNGLNKDFLALGDHITLVDQEELSALIAKCLIADTVDPQISDSFIKGLGLMAGIVMNRLYSKAEDSDVQIVLNNAAVEDNQSITDKGFIELIKKINALEQYGKELKSRGRPAINLAKNLRKTVCDYAEGKINKEDATPKIHTLIQQGKVTMQEDRRALDILAHIFIACTVIGFAFMLAQKARTGTFFFNKTKREDLLASVKEESSHTSLASSL